MKCTISHLHIICNERLEDIWLSKTALHSRQQTRMSRWSVSGTHKAQEIKAVNKGLSDKESPDSYESRAGRVLVAGWFRTRADGHEKTNHSDEHEGHHLHLALPIHADFHLFSLLSSSLTVIYPTSFFSHLSTSIFFSLIFVCFWQFLCFKLDVAIINKLSIQVKSKRTTSSKVQVY